MLFHSGKIELKKNNKFRYKISCSSILKEKILSISMLQLIVTAIGRLTILKQKKQSYLR